MSHSGGGQAFKAWLLDEFKRQGVETPAEVARRLGVSTSTITRPVKRPRPETMRAAADALGVPMRRVLVAAGYLTPEEADVPVTLPLSLASAGDLLEELRRRLEACGELEQLGASRGIGGPSRGESRRRPGKDAGEENQDPGGDWDGA